MQIHKSEILIIVAIIAASYLFSMDEVKFLDTQLMFILITLGIVIMYKLMYIQKIKNIEENFHVGIPQGGLSQYVNQDDTSDKYIKIEEYKELKTKLENLQKAISNRVQTNNSVKKKNNIEELIYDSGEIEKKN